MNGPHIHLSGAELAGIIAAAALVLGLVWSVGYAADKHGLGAVIWRWHSGHSVDGEARTDAGWMIRGTRAFTKTGRAHRWHYMPRAARAGIRTGTTAAALAAAYGMWAARTVTLAALAGAALAALALGAWAAYRGVANWRHYRQWVRPLHLSLGHALGLPADVRPASWLRVPRGFQRIEGAEIRVMLPDRFAPTADVRRALAAIVAAKLAIEDPRADWHLHGARPSVTFTTQLAPPDRVGLDRVRDLIAAARDTAPLLGLGRGGAAVHADLDNDSPHVLISAGSGGGKSTIARLIAAQVLARGGLVLVLDLKRLSHSWARGLPGVRYARDIAEIHDACLWLRDELDRRNQLADEGADVDGNTDHVDIGPRLLVVAEEMNATAGRLAKHWRAIKTKDDPTQSPAVEALAEVFFLGRQCRVNCLAIAQMLTARSVGGPEARESCGLRLLSRYSMNNARMLCPEIWPFPPASRKPGRVQVCVGGVARETQIASLSPAEARQLAALGAAVFPPAEAPAPPTPPTPPRLRAVDTPELIGLAAAVAEGLVPISLDAIRRARGRDPEFPAHQAVGPGGERLYRPDDLRAWARNRPRASAASA